MEAVKTDDLMKLKAALLLLPTNKRDYLMGYAEGVLALAEQRRAEQAQDSA